MKKSALLFLTALFVMLSFQTIQAEVKLPAIVSSNMVLQRDATIVLWGWADANEKFTLKPSWLENAIPVEANDSGDWRLEIKTTNSKDSQSVKIEGSSNTIVLDNILFGEVWLCSGQSNMRRTFKQFVKTPMFSAVLKTKKASNPNLRFFTVINVGAKAPLKDVGKHEAWQQTNPDNLYTFSVLAYYFGQQLQETLDCPVGLIYSTYGGSKVEAWISKEVLSTYQKVDVKDLDITKKTNMIPTVLYNAMINPLIPYTIKGMLWYQGESNRRNPDDYKKLLPAMVKDWRARWGQGEFPFYYAQIAPYWYKNNDVFETFENSAYLRESQLECLDVIPNSNMVVTLDVGDKYDIHPTKKKEVADRFLYNVLSKTYGYTDIEYASPSYKSLEVKEDAILLNFKDTGEGLYAFDDLRDFEIAGDNKVFYPAEAKIVENQYVLVSSNKVNKPVAVRYAWRNWVSGSLFGVNLMPVSSFRTDRWDDAKRAKN